jgi:hypothetical protein
MQYDSLKDLVEHLRQRGIREVTLSGKVATTTSPGGGQIAFRGRLVISADLGGGQSVQYEEQVMPYVAHAEAPDVPATFEREADLRAARQELARQLRAFRGEYQAVMDAARAQLRRRLAQDGITVAEPA